MEPDAPHLHVLQYDEEGHQEWRPSAFEEVRGRLDSRRVTWINIDSTKDLATLTALEREFQIHPLTMEDIRNARQRPKVEAYPGYLYIVTQMVLRDERERLRTEQVSILLGDSWVVTVQERSGDVFDGVRGRIRQGGPRIRRSGPDYLAYALLDAVVDGYFPILEWFSQRTEELEEAIIEETSQDTRERLQELRRDLLTMRRIAWPQRDAIATLERSENGRFTPDTRTYLRDVSDHVTRVIDIIEVDRELAASLTELHMANIAQKTNEVMRVLTVVATIFIPLTFIAGVYGMNFAYMPELAWRWGYPVVLAFMATLGIGMYWSFHRRGWV